MREKKIRLIFIVSNIVSNSYGFINLLLTLKRFKSSSSNLRLPDDKITGTLKLTFSEFWQYNPIHSFRHIIIND